MSDNCYGRKSAVRRVSKEEVEDVDERLTRRHVQTLAFVQEIANENKGLKERILELEEQLAGCAQLHELAADAQGKIKAIQAQYLARADEVNKLLTDKHRLELMKKEEDGIASEKRWVQEQASMKAEIDQLTRAIKELQAKLDVAMGYKDQVEVYEHRVTELEDKIHYQDSELERYRLEASNQVLEMQRIPALEEHGGRLKSQLQEVQQKNKELEYRLRQLQREVSDVGYREQEDTLNLLKENLKKLFKEKEGWQDKDRQMGKSLEDLQTENDKLRRALNDSERMRAELYERVQKMEEELVTLRKNAPDKDNKTFREFVILKREASALREENNDLKLKLKGKVKQKETLTSVLKPEVAAKPSSSTGPRRKSDNPHALYTQK